MRRLNQKGMTTIELILSFVLVTIVTVSMYDTISTFNSKRLEEESKAKVFTYKNTLTKAIQDDLVKIGLYSVEVNNSPSSTAYEETAIFRLKDGTSRTLVIHASKFEQEDDEFIVSYGTEGDMINYDIPDLGSYESNGKQVKSLRIKPKESEFITSTNNTLKIVIVFSQPDLQENKYYIKIVCPINYVSSGSDETAALFH